MDIQPILQQLIAERDNLDEAIHALELITTGQKRRGRPPKWITEANRIAEPAQPEPKRRGRPRKNP